MKTLIFHDILILTPCAFDPCHDCHAPGWSDRKRLGRLGQLHSISFARLREWTRRAGARGFLGSRRFHGRRKRGGLQATSCYRDQAWSHFDVGHHGIHHPSDLDLLKLRLRSFQYSMFLLYNVSISAITLYSCGIYRQFVCLDETIPRRSLANSLATYLHLPVWSSPMCLMVWLPSQRSQLQDRVETIDSTSKPHISKYII